MPVEIRPAEMGKCHVGEDNDASFSVHPWEHVGLPGIRNSMLRRHQRTEEHPSTLVGELRP